MKQADWNTVCEEVRKGRMVQTHSAQVRPGDIFVALAGTRVHGTCFAAEAVQRGAVFIVTNDRSLQLPPEAALVYHENPAQALGELAVLYFQREKKQPRIVAVTGTNGKTTTAYLIEHLLLANRHQAGLIGTVVCRWPGHSQAASMTTPDCWTLHALLARMAENDVSCVSMEVSSHALAQQRLAGLRPEVAVFTNLTQDHLDYHQTMEAYFEAKLQLFQQDVLRVVNVDDPYGLRIADAFSCLRFTFAADTGRTDTLYGKVTRLDREGLCLECCYQGRKWTVRSRLVGLFNASNLLAAQGVGLALGFLPEQLDVFTDFSGAPGRLQRVLGTSLHVFVDYAHTPDALENVCSTLKQLDYGRLIVLFGCGGDRDRGKRPLMGAAVARYADRAIVTSDNPRHEDARQIIQDIVPGFEGFSEYICEPDRKKAIGLALDELGENDVLLIAGKCHEN